MTDGGGRRARRIAKASRSMPDRLAGRPGAPCCVEALDHVPVGGDHDVALALAGVVREAQHRLRVDDRLVGRDRDLLGGLELDGGAALAVVVEGRELDGAHHDALVGDAEAHALAGEPGRAPEARISPASSSGRTISPSWTRPGGRGSTAALASVTRSRAVLSSTPAMALEPMSSATTVLIVRTSVSRGAGEAEAMRGGAIHHPSRSVYQPIIDGPNHRADQGAGGEERAEGNGHLAGARAEAREQDHAEGGAQGEGEEERRDDGRAEHGAEQQGELDVAEAHAARVEEVEEVEEAGGAEGGRRPSTHQSAGSDGDRRRQAEGRGGQHDDVRDQVVLEVDDDDRHQRDAEQGGREALPRRAEGEDRARPRAAPLASSMAG